MGEMVTMYMQSASLDLPQVVMTAKLDLERFRVRGVPATAYLVPDFVTVGEEAVLLNHIQNSPRAKWVHLSNRRLQNYGGVPDPRGMVQEPMPGWLQKYVDRINELRIFASHIEDSGCDDGKGLRKANHVLLNEYLSGQGIMPHVDGDLFYPTISTVSLGSHTLLDFYEHSDLPSTPDGEELFSLLVEPRTLLVLKDDLYTNFKHGIKEVIADSISEKVVVPEGTVGDVRVGRELQRQTRISITIRHVPKTKKFVLKL